MKINAVKLSEVWQERAGRIRAVAFYCQRCKEIQFEIITPEMVESSEDNLQCYKRPRGWGEHGYGLLCEKCFEEYKAFMKDGGEC